jgi:hypothetical protein
MRRNPAPLVLLLAAALGCGDGPRLVPVSGKVTLDGKPLFHKSVYFHPQPGTPGNGAADVTKEDGSYRLLYIRSGATKVFPGAPPGAYRVVIAEAKIAAKEAPKGAEPPGPEPAVIPTMPWRKRPVIPARYSNPETTPLSVEVSAGGGTIDLELTSRP